MLFARVVGVPSTAQSANTECSGDTDAGGHGSRDRSLTRIGGSIPDSCTQCVCVFGQDTEPHIYLTKAQPSVRERMWVRLLLLMSRWHLRG